MTTWSNDHLIEFIELFREQEPLWKIRHKDYHNNVKRTVCYNVLLEKMKIIDNTADLNKVKKKINNLRTVFRKELKKQNDSLLSGSSADEVYSPKLSYFENLMFLKDQEMPHEGESSIKSTITEEQHEDANENSCKVQSPSGTQAENDDILPPPPTPSRLKRKKSSQVSNSTIDLTLDNINQKNLSLKPDDTCDIFGKTVASKLKSLPKDQRIWAEKIINETLLEAELGNLNRQCVSRVNNILNNSSQDWQPNTSPFSQPRTSPYSQPHTSPYSQPHTSPYSQPRISPYSQPHTSPYSQPNTSPYSQSHTSSHYQPQTSPYSQSQMSPYSQPQESPFSQSHLSQNIPSNQQEIQTPPEEQTTLLHIPENQSSKPQTPPLLQARQRPTGEQLSDAKEQNLINFFENFQS